MSIDKEKHISDLRIKFESYAPEDSLLISLDYKSYRSLIRENKDLANFYISYLEKNWVIDWEQVEVSLILENATERYLNLRKVRSSSRHPSSRI